jgi:sterol desaturase/sphingolipid hydroxylase (fatty acid hydroxylase superfamily)
MTSVVVWILNIVLSDAFVLMCSMFAIIGLVEYFFPAQKIQRRHYALNLRYGLVNALLIGAIMPFLSAGTARAIQSVGLGFVDLRALGFGGFGGDLFAVGVGTLIWDFLQYWWHRLFHANSVLWQMHLLHHSDEHMNVTTETRHHVLEIALASVFITIPTAIIFKVPAVNIATLSLVPYAWTYFTHANINLGFGPLWWLMTSPDYHRIHHSILPEHRDKNFVNWFPIWDILFGTAVVPRRGEGLSNGVAGVSVRSLPQAYLLPLQGWLRMTGRRRSPSQAPH